MKVIFIYLFSITSFLALAQSQPTDFTTAEIDSINTNNLAAEGNLYHDYNLGIYYIGLTDMSLKEIGNVTTQGSNNEDVLRWDTLSNKWKATPKNSNTLTLTKTTLNSIKRARIIVQEESEINAATTFNITPSNFVFNQTNAIISGTTITGLEGDVRIEFQPNFNTIVVERSNFNCALFVNGVLESRVYGHNYIRRFAGHESASSNWIFEIEDASPSDIFQLTLEREANLGSVQLVSSAPNNSYIFIEQSEEVEVITDIAAPIDLNIAVGPQGPQGTQGIQGPQGAPGEVINSPLEVYHAAGNIHFSGVANYIVGASVSRTNPGRYTVTFSTPHPNGTNYPVLFSMEQNAGTDDYVPAYLNATANGFDVEITEQDNGTTGGVFRDAGFSFYTPLGDIPPDDNGGSPGLPTPSGPPAGSNINFANLSDQNSTAPFQLQIQGQGENIVTQQRHEVFLDNVPYQVDLANLNVQSNDIAYTTSFNDNGDGTYDYIFTSTTPMNNAWQFITIQSSPPVGGTGTGSNCGCVSLYFIP